MTPSDSLEIDVLCGLSRKFEVYDDRSVVEQDVSVLGVDNDKLICENTRPRLGVVVRIREPQLPQEPLQEAVCEVHERLQ